MPLTTMSMMTDDEGISESAALSAQDNRYSEGFLIFVRDVKNELKKCNKLDLPLEFIVNIIKLAAIDPNNKFLIKQQMVAAEVERLKRIVTEKIIRMSEISRNMIKMQLYFRDKWMSREQVIAAYRDEVDEKVVPLMNEMKQSIPKHLRHYEMYYMKIIGATIYYANMGPDTEPSVVHETQEAIEKIFNKDDITLLESMSPADREMQLMHIISIAVGLRLLTKNSNPDQYGEQIDDLAEDLPKKLQDGIQQFQSMKSLNTERLIKYTTAIQKYFLKHFVIRGGRREVSLGMVKARQGLSMVHQLLFYVKDITEEFITEEKHVQQLVGHYQSIIAELQTYQNQTNVPSTEVYPKYIELCECWQNLLDSSVFVKTLLNLSMEMIQLSEKDLLPMDDFIDDFLTAVNMKVPSEQEFFNFPQGRIDLENNTHGLKKIEYRGDMNPSTMNFSGFCLNSLVRGAGMLVVGNPNLGVFTWKNMNFMFSTVEAATEFAKNPAVVVRRAIGIARRWPELIMLLNVEAEAYDATAQSETDGYRKLFSGLLVSKSSGMQCELHPIPSNIIESYTWNEWELRRRGIILSKIHKRRTHSTQTHWQALKKTTACQTFAQRSQEIQTNRNVHTSVPKTMYYFAGLRGYHCGMSPHIVELTSETPDDLHCVCKPKKKEETGLLIGEDKMMRKSIDI